VTAGAELRLARTADVHAPRPIRNALAAFLAALDLEQVVREDILVAVGEALANSVEHAYLDDPGTVELHARAEDATTLMIDVLDRGHFHDRELTPGRGLGLRIVRAIARKVHVDTDGGTRISMIFDAAVPPG
jgi:anti-sigma regulatory factor (Ser/Thr protein kinase)